MAAENETSYVLEGSFGGPPAQPAAPTPPAGDGTASISATAAAAAAAASPDDGAALYVNEGLDRWNAGRTAWLKQSAGAARPRPKDIEIDEVIETIFAPQFGGKLPCAVPLPQMVDLMVDLWEADGLFD